jgi:hypothetical protein
MMDELMEVEEWIEDEEFIEDEGFIEDSWMELEKARGEKVIKCTKKKQKASKNNSIEELIIVFEDTDNLDIEETFGIRINGKSIVVGKHDKNNTSFKEINVKNLKGKRFLEYVAGQIEDISGPELKLTLAFEKGYSIEISDYSIIEEYK